MEAVFIDSFYDVGHTTFAEHKFRENTEKLLQFALDMVEPFECKDIEKATLEIREQQERLNELTLAVDQVEKQKQSLMMTLEMMRHKNYLLERNNQNLSMQVMSTMSPLQDKKENTHSTTSFIMISFILIIFGIILGGGASSWYNHRSVEVMELCHVFSSSTLLRSVELQYFHHLYIYLYRCLYLTPSHNSYWF